MLNLLKEGLFLHFCHADRSPHIPLFCPTVALLDAAVSVGSAGLRLIPRQENICRTASRSRGDAATFTATGFGHGLLSLGLSVGDDLPADHRLAESVEYPAENLWLAGDSGCDGYCHLGTGIIQ
ncbi:MAG: hypothetical protein U0V49_00980 [Saprospiraceae bacterium]